MNIDRAKELATDRLWDETHGSDATEVDVKADRLEAFIEEVEGAVFALAEAQKDVESAEADYYQVFTTQTTEEDAKRLRLALQRAQGALSIRAFIFCAVWDAGRAHL